jgi:asparagine synthase (glutamine-hydrolysing)
MSAESRDYRESRVLPMIDALAHRGPDDSGLWSGEHCTLGHRRLAIIDLSPAGHQPLSNDDGSLWITFNGEIYNFIQLRAELETRGYTFRTRTDTEVIIRAYEEWDTDCVSHLRGMFVFALWDQRKQRLFLARDRVGKKPLFYTHSNGSFYFASELQGLLVNKDISREVDRKAIDAYLSWGYVPAPKTAFRGIRKLPPAHWMTLEKGAALGKGSDGWIEHIERYWSLDYLPKSSLSEGEAIEVLREKMTEAVRLRMISDVPLGAFLSGGIDSSIVVGLMAQISQQPVKTFSIGFKQAEWDETAHAARIAELWKTDHHRFVVEPKALEIIPMLVRHYGEPYADSSAIPTFYVSKLTRAEVTVALNGDGGDESFAGYERYLGNRIAESLRSVPGSGWLAGQVAQMLPADSHPKSRVTQARRFLSVAAERMPARYGRWIGYFDEDAKNALYSKDFMADLKGAKSSAWMARLFDEAAGLDPVDASMAVDIGSYLPYDLLVKVDITSMANSLEARSPFLDHEVMEFAASLPVDLKLRGRESKYLLKKAFADLLPAENVARRKMGFGVPVGEWFRTELKDFLRETLLSDEAGQRGYFDRHKIEALVREHSENSVDHSAKLWNLMMLELWHREFLPM